MIPFLAVNKRAAFDFEILETWEAGLILSGAEVKSLRLKEASLNNAYVTINGREVWLINAHVSPYRKAGLLSDYDPRQRRKLLLKKAEIRRLRQAKEQRGLTIVPLKVYTKKNRLKLEIGLGRGRKKTDKRELIKKRDLTREIRREFKGDAGHR